MNAEKNSSLTVDDIVTRGLCIGCGLCAAIDGHRTVKMDWTPQQRLRPITHGQTPTTTLDAINRACPGVRVAGIPVNATGDHAAWDAVWGYLGTSCYAHATDAHVRHESSTGGALNALAIHLIESGEVAAVLHTGPAPERPARSKWRLSTSRDEILGSGGSRYGPTSPLEGLDAALASNVPFAFIGKPCDVSALRLHARDDAALAERCRYLLALVCGGQSEFTKTASLLDSWSFREADLAELRYRGRGNPGPTIARRTDGEMRATSYLDLWEDETSWALPHRCKVCPDAIGMAADIIAADCWTGGAPTGEDAGMNAVAARTTAGERLLHAAFESSALTHGASLTIADWSEFQPHQVRKREAVWARLAGHRAAGLGTLRTEELGIADLARRRALAANLTEARGTRVRAVNGSAAEPVPTPATRSSAPASPTNG